MFLAWFGTFVVTPLAITMFLASILLITYLFSRIEWGSTAKKAKGDGGGSRLPVMIGKTGGKQCVGVKCPTGQANYAFRKDKLDITKATFTMDEGQREHATLDKKPLYWDVDQKRAVDKDGDQYTAEELHKHLDAGKLSYATAPSKLANMLGGIGATGAAVAGGMRAIGSAVGSGAGAIVSAARRGSPAEQVDQPPSSRPVRRVAKTSSENRNVLKE